MRGEDPREASRAAPADRASPGAEPAVAATEADVAAMRRALAVARHADPASGEAPIGCVIVLDGVVVGEGHNEVGLRHDPTAHAEMVAIRRACAGLAREDLRGATLYSTLQPCGMCTMASLWCHIGRIVYGAGRDLVHPDYFEDRHLDTMNFIRDARESDLEVIEGVLSPECAQLYRGPEEPTP